MMQTGTTVFISYCGEAGMAIARQISDALSALKVKAYVPIKPIWESEAAWDDELIEEIRKSGGVVFIEPETDVGAGHVLFELGAARALGKATVGVGRRANAADFEESISETIFHSFEILDPNDTEPVDFARALLQSLNWPAV